MSFTAGGNNLPSPPLTEGLVLIARVPLLALSYLVPGWLLLRACGLPREIAPAFALSAGVIYVIGTGVILAGVQLSLLSIGTLLIATCLGLGALRPVRRAAETGRVFAPGQAPKWLLPLLAASVALFAWRAFAQPLTGPDTSFRWNLLALELVRTGELSFYPPVTLENFARYFYADGFPPLVALHYWWTYVVLGSTAPHVTGFVVTAQFAATLALVAQTVRAHAGNTTGLITATVVASSGLVFWAFHLGQETGWICLALAATAWVWTTGSSSRLGTAVAAAIALLPALVAREYGPALLVVGVLLAVHYGAAARPVIAFAAVAAVLAAPWYMQVWARTGNPFYTLSPGSLFPVNETLSELLASYEQRFGFTQQRPGLLAYRALDLLVNSPLLFVAGIGALASPRRLWAGFGAVAVLVALWFASVGYTSGGLHIANRMLAPAGVLLAILGADIWPRLLERGRLAHVVISSVALVAVFRGIYANGMPPQGPGLPSPRAWWSSVKSIHEAPPALPIAIEAGGDGAWLSDNAYLHAHERAAGSRRRILPYWATEVRFLFSPAITAEESATRLRALGVEFVHVARAGSPNWAHWQTFPFFNRIVETWPTVANSAGLELRRVPTKNLSPSEESGRSG